MTIAFECPNCRKPYKVRDELAGKKATCSACKKPIVVPRGSAHHDGALEALASSTLSDHDPAPAAVEAPGFIELDCPFCFEKIQFEAAKTDKRAPCPICRKIIKVASPKQEKPSDWRDVANRPAGVRLDTEPPPTGAWGSVLSSSVVSRDALLEARAIKHRKFQVNPRRKIWVATAAVLAVALVGGFGLWKWRTAADDKVIELIGYAEAALDPTADRPVLAGPAAEIHRAIGECHLRGRPANLDAALKHLRESRSRIDKVESPFDRFQLLSELALTQVDLGGSDDDAKERKRLNWSDTQRELRQTVQLLAAAPPEAKSLVWGQLAGKLGRNGPADMPVVKAIALAVYPTDGERAEGLAIIGLEMLGRDDADQQFAEELLKEAREPPAAGSPSSRVVALMVALKQLEQARQLIAEPTAADVSLPARLAYAEGYARSGDAGGLEKARAIALFPGTLEHRLQALVMVAEAAFAVHSGNVRELEEAVALAEGQLKSQSVNPWILLRLGQLCRRAGRPDLGHKIAEEAATTPVAGWLQFEALRAELASTAGEADWKLADGVGEKDSLVQALARQAIARHNAGVGKDPLPVVRSWTAAGHQALGFVGAALGMLDRKR